jgi:hypothetical protein
MTGNKAGLGLIYKEVLDRIMLGRLACKTDKKAIEGDYRWNTKIESLPASSMGSVRKK